MALHDESCVVPFILFAGGLNCHESLALSGMCFSSTNANDFVSSNPSIYCFIAYWLLGDEYLGSVFNRTSVRNMSS